MGTARTLASRQLRRAPGMTAAIVGALGAIIALVAVFEVVGDAQVRSLSGALAENDAHLWVLAAGAQGALPASRVDPSWVDTVGAIDGVAAVGPVGEVRLGVRIDGGALVDASLWGIDPDSPAAPPVTDGRTVTAENEAVVDAADRHLGAVPGAAVDLADVDGRLEIVGMTEERRFASIPTFTVAYERWVQVIDDLNPDSDEVFPTALAVRLREGADPEAVASAIADRTDELVAVPPAQLASDLPGIDGLRSSFSTAALVALVAVAAVSGAFTRLQVEHEHRTLATLRALGAPPGTLRRATQLRVAVLVLLGATVATVLVAVAERTTPPQIPISLAPRSLIVIALATWAAAALAAARGLRAVRRLDPADVLRAPT